MAERTLKEYATPSAEEPQAIIVYPTVESNNFEIKPALLNLVEQNQISGSPASSQTLGVFPGQTEANPKAHVNTISFGGSKLEETITKARKFKEGVLSFWVRMSR